jgi:hypothetical protein
VAVASAAAYQKYAAAYATMNAVVLVADHVHSSLRDLTDEQWRATLPALLDDFQQLLRDALDLLRELGEGDARSDRSYWGLPSISPHWQNKDFRDWVTLIELLRDAWLAARKSNPLRAHQVALAWFDLPYSTFKRLALFAASQKDCIEPAQWVEWLILGEFPSALAAVVDWLLPVEHPHYIVDRLYESGLCARFPDVALRLLDAILDDQPWAPEELGQCLEAIAQAAPALRQDPQYQRLVEFGRRRGN